MPIQHHRFSGTLECNIVWNTSTSDEDQLPGCDSNNSILETRPVSPTIIILDSEDSDLSGNFDTPRFVSVLL